MSTNGILGSASAIRAQISAVATERAAEAAKASGPAATQGAAAGSTAASAAPPGDSFVQAKPQNGAPQSMSYGAYSPRGPLAPPSGLQRSNPNNSPLGHIFEGIDLKGLGLMLGAAAAEQNYKD